MNRKFNTYLYKGDRVFSLLMLGMGAAFVLLFLGQPVCRLGFSDALCAELPRNALKGLAAACAAELLFARDISGGIVLGGIFCCLCMALAGLAAF